MDTIAILDFGSQYTHLIANRVRKLGIYAEILLPETPLENLKKYKGIILSGGPQSVYDKNSATVDRAIFELGIPILGLCYGHQLIAHLLGGKVEPGVTKEYGLAELTAKKAVGLFKGLKKKSTVWMSHGDTVSAQPPDFTVIGETLDCPIAAMMSEKRRIFSTQFHVEVKHSHEGLKMLKNFLALTGAKKQWTLTKFFEEKKAALKKIIADRRVFFLVSGGVDSTVAYTFLAKVIGADKVYGLFVDTGFLRKNERTKIQKAMRRVGIKSLHVEDASKIFFKALAGVTEPEEKRIIIGRLFLEIQAKVAKKLRLNPDHWLLGQGTIYPDTIESAGTKYADKIKTHHNRVPEILALIEQGKIVEPVADLYKDEVRTLGEKLHLPAEVVWRHPFPGPGLAIRILCAQQETMPLTHATVQQSIAEFLAPYGLHGTILPVQSVGVQGDNRTYRNPLVIWHENPKVVINFDELEKISTSLTNHFFEINRVCLLLTPDKIDEVTLVPATLTPRRVKLAQDLDDIVMEFIKRNKVERTLWQFPTVLVPLSINGVKKEAVVLRPMCSDEAMTAHFYKMSWPLLQKLTQKLKPHVSGILYDVTNKPPGTIEWE